MIAYFVRHPTLANIVMMGIIALGFIAYPQLKRESMPEVANDTVEIRTIYRGATAEDIENAVCRRIEEALEGIVNLDEVRCEARESLSIAKAILIEGADMSRFLNDVRSAVESIDAFPSDVEKSTVTEIGRTSFVASLIITGPEQPTDLKAYTETVKSRLMRTGKIPKVTLKGFSDHQIRIEIPGERMRGFGLSAVDFANVVQAQNVDLPTGVIEGEDADLILRFDDGRTTAAEFRDLVVISASTGAEIRLGDIATITDTFEKAEEKIEFNGQRAAMLDIEKTSAEDALDIVSVLRNFVEKEVQRAPQGIQITLIRDTSDLVMQRLTMLVKNGAQGLVLVFLTLFLFFSLRYSFWVTMGLPVSFLGALFAMWVIGYSINMITMVGLLVAIGLLMDDAIVVAENIARHLQRGEKPKQAAIRGAQEVLPGIISSFLTTVFIFGSLAFISGNIGQVMKVLPVVLILTLSVSLIEAFLILPRHLSHSLKGPHVEPARWRQNVERGFNHMRDQWFGKAIEQMVRWRYFTIGIMVMLLLFTLALPLGGSVKFVAFPELDGDTVEARLLLPQGTPLARTEHIVKQVTTAIRQLNDEFKSEQPDQQDIIKHVTVLYGQNPDAFESGPHVAQIIVDLLGAETRNGSADDVINRWRKIVGLQPDVIASIYTKSSVGPAGRAIDIRLHGEDLSELKAASLELLNFLSGFSGVLDLSDDLRPGKKEIRLRIKDGASSLGLNAEQIARQLQAAFQGVIIDEIQVGTETYEIELQLARAERANPGDLDRFMVVGANGALVPLSTVADIKIGRGWGRINRINGERTIAIQGNIDTMKANASEIIAVAQSEFLPDLLERYPNLSFSIKGQSAEGGETGQSLVRNVLYGLIGVYLLLAFQFRSFITPVIVMIIIPAGLIGALWGHYLLGIDVSLPSMIGIASLAGVVVNNSILLVQFMEMAYQNGETIEHAANHAARRRFRPIFLATTTTVVGLLPLLLEKSLQAQILIPIAVSLAFGLAAATLIALFVVPSFYCVFHDIGLIKNNKNASEDQIT